MNKTVASLELFTAATLWGFGFVATVWAMQRLSPFELTFLRFAIAGLFIFPFLMTRAGRSGLRAHVGDAFWPGVFFASTLIVQTWGLKYTTATKSGFITTLYVVFMPFLESWLDRTRLPRALWACVVLSFVGTVLIVNMGLSDINKGDLLTLACALLATGQIYVIGKVSPRVKRPFVFNTLQALWAALFCLPFAFSPGLWGRVGEFADWPRTAQIGLLSLAFGSTVVAFALQVRAQAWLSPTVSSLLFLLESPFAMLFSIVLLGETLGPVEACGATLIFLSALTASLLESRRKKF